jgi:predicted ribosome-associated RNA-binding protein Tma20
MAYEIPGQSFTAIAAVDLTGKKGYGIVIDGNGKAALAGAAAVIDGVLRYEGKAGEAVTVVKDGHMGLVFGAAVADGAQLATDANGAFITAVATNPIVAVAREAAGGAGEIHKGLLGYKGVKA